MKETTKNEDETLASPGAAADAERDGAQPADEHEVPERTPVVNEQEERVAAREHEEPVIGNEREDSVDASEQEESVVAGERERHVAVAGVDEGRAVVAREVERRAVVRGSRKRTVVMAVAVVAVVALGLLLWLFTRGGTGGGGRPVPAPRITTNGATSSGDSVVTSEPTVTVPPEVAARSGIVVETVGESLATGEVGAAEISTGVVQANTYRTTPVVSLVGGIVRRVNVELGQSVRRGQTIAVVFSDELAEAQSRYLNALAVLDEQQRRYRRTEQLVEIGAASRQELEETTTRLRTADSSVASLRQRLILLGLAPARVDAIRSTSQISSEVELPAPVSGTVTERAVNPGEVIAANREVVRVADLSTVWVIGQVYEKDLGRIRVGSGASVTSEAYPGRVFRGRVTYTDPQLDPATRTAQVRVELGNPAQALKLGMYVDIAFAALGGAEATAPTVPASAVQNLGERRVVFLATPDPNLFIVRAVRLGPLVDGRYTVLEGLFVGDRVVTEGSFMLRAEWLKLNPDGLRTQP